MDTFASQSRAFVSWWKLIRVAAANPRRPMKKTERQKRLEDLFDVHGIEALIIEVDHLEVEVKVSLGGVMVELLILNPINMSLSI